jgi:hypothetical protein
VIAPEDAAELSDAAAELRAAVEALYGAEVVCEQLESQLTSRTPRDFRILIEGAANAVRTVQARMLNLADALEKLTTST